MLPLLDNKYKTKLRKWLRRDTKKENRRMIMVNGGNSNRFWWWRYNILILLSYTRFYQENTLRLSCFLEKRRILLLPVPFLFFLFVPHVLIHYRNHLFFFSECAPASISKKMKLSGLPIASKKIKKEGEWEQKRSKLYTRQLGNCMYVEKEMYVGWQ